MKKDELFDECFNGVEGMLEMGESYADVVQFVTNEKYDRLTPIQVNYILNYARFNKKSQENKRTRLPFRVRQKLGKTDMLNLKAGTQYQGGNHASDNLDLDNLLTDF